MKKVLVISLALVVLLCMSANATATRVVTMGDNNMIILDGANMNIFPSRLYNYPDIVRCEFGSVNQFSKFGIHWKFGEENPFVLATYFYNNTPETPTYSPIGVPVNKNKRIDLFYSSMFGEHKFGFHFGLRHSSDVYDDEDKKDEDCLSIYRFDFGLTPDGDQIDVAAGLEFMTWSDKATLMDKSAYNETEPSGNMSFYLRGRYFHTMDSKCTFVPHAELRFGKYEGKDYTAYTTVPNPRPDSAVHSGTEKNNTLTLNLGAGMQYTPATKVLAVLDFGIMFDKVKKETTDELADPKTTTESTEKTFTLPYFKVGFEADVFSWMKVRFGSTSYWKNYTNDQTTIKDKRTQKYPENKTYLGFGFHWNQLYVDAQTDPQLFLNGFNFISGTTTTMNTRISILYKMM